MRELSGECLPCAVKHRETLNVGKKLSKQWFSNIIAISNNKPVLLIALLLLLLLFYDPSGYNGYLTTLLVTKIAGWVITTELLLAYWVTENFGKLTTKQITWADIGFIYFGATALAIGFNHHLTEMIFDLSVLNMLCLPFTFYSIFTQWRSGKWCIYCCLVQLILWLEFLAFIPYHHFTADAVKFIFLYRIVLTFALITAVWLLLKYLWVSARQVEKLSVEFKKFGHGHSLSRDVLNDKKKFEFPDQHYLKINDTTAFDTSGVDSSSFRKSAKSGYSYLINAIRADGSFIYQINSDTGNILPQYNLLRHCGTLYLLYQYMIQNQNRDDAERLRKAIDYLKDYVNVYNEEDGTFYIAEEHNAKLGGSALGLLALIEHFNYTHQGENLAMMKGLAAFLMTTQQISGKFHSKILMRDKTVSTFQSVYYPGQAILALINFYLIDRNNKWLTAAEKGIAFLISNPVINTDGERAHNHWFATALSRYYLTCIKRIDVYIELTRITEATIYEAEINLKNGKNKYSFSTAELATRAETVAAALEVERERNNTSRTVYLENHLYKMLNGCLTNQISENKVYQGFNLKGGFKKGNNQPEIRIDFVQHVLQSLLVV